MFKKNGAPDKTNLEPDQAVSILEELEEWECYLRSDPEVALKLRALEEAAVGRDEKVGERPVARSRPRGPSL